MLPSILFWIKGVLEYLALQASWRPEKQRSYWCCWAFSLSFSWFFVWFGWKVVCSGFTSTSLHCKMYMDTTPEYQPGSTWYHFRQSSIFTFLPYRKLYRRLRRSHWRYENVRTTVQSTWEMVLFARSTSHLPCIGMGFLRFYGPFCFLMFLSTVVATPRTWYNVGLLSWSYNNAKIVICFWNASRTADESVTLLNEITRYSWVLRVSSL